MCYPDNVAQIASLKPDFMGFIFYPLSPRNALSTPSSVFLQLPPEITPVAVFVDSLSDEIIEITSSRNISVVQLHGNESPEFCAGLKGKGITVIKAFKIQNDPDTFSFDQLSSYVGNVDYFLFDTAGKNQGGNGIKFDWKILSNYHLTTPFLLSGGIGPDDNDLSVDEIHPQCIGIDINSKFEISPGVKDVDKVSQFLITIRNEQTEYSSKK